MAPETRRASFAAGSSWLMGFEQGAERFSGTVRNMTSQTVRDARIEIHLSNGVELGPTPVEGDAGDTLPVELDARGQTLDWSSGHVEPGSTWKLGRRASGRLRRPLLTWATRDVAVDIAATQRARAGAFRSSVNADGDKLEDEWHGLVQRFVDSPWARPVCAGPSPAPAADAAGRPDRPALQTGCGEGRVMSLESPPIAAA